MADTNPLLDIIEAATKLGPALTGSKTRTSETTATDPGSNAAVQNLLAQILPMTSGGIDNPTYQALMGSITDNVKMNLLPLVGSEKKAGLYQSTAVPGFAALLGGQGIKQSAEAILKSQQQAQATAAQLVAATAKNNATTTKMAELPGNPLLQAAGLGVGALGLGQKLGVFGSKKAPTPKVPDWQRDIDDAIKNGATSASDADILDAIRGSNMDSIPYAGPDEAFTQTPYAGPDEFFASPTDVGNFTTATNAVESGEISLGMGAADTFGLSEGAGALGAASDLAVAGEAAGIGEAAIGMGAAEAFGGAAAATGAEWIAGEALVDAAASVAVSSIVCIEAVNQGLMPKELYLREVALNAKRLSANTIKGYHVLATPAVRKMRKYPAFARLLANCAIAYSKHVLGDKRSILGYLLQSCGEPLCAFIGKRAKPIDWQKQLKLTVLV